LSWSCATFLKDFTKENKYIMSPCIHLSLDMKSAEIVWIFSGNLIDKSEWNLHLFILFCPEVEWSHPFTSISPPTAMPYWSAPWNMGMLLDASVVAWLVWIVWPGDTLTSAYPLKNPPSPENYPKARFSIHPEIIQKLFSLQISNVNVIILFFLPCSNPYRKSVQPFHQRNQQNSSLPPPYTKKIPTIKQRGDFSSIKARS
jgi:hypothetical protein